MAASGRAAADATLIAVLATGSTQEDAATLANVSARTIRRRLDSPDFVQRLHVAREALVDRSVSIVAAASANAALTLEALLEARSENVRLGAARALLDFAHRGLDDANIERRLASLEKTTTSSDLTPEEAAVAWEAVTAVRRGMPMPDLSAYEVKTEGGGE